MIGQVIKYYTIKTSIMNKTILALLILILGSHLISLFGIWWLFVIIPILVFVLPSFKNLNAFWISFLGVFLLWLVYSIWLNMGDSFNLANKIGDLFGGLPGIIIAVIGSTLAGFLGGLSGWIGSETRKLMNY